MNERIKSAFDSVKAEEELKEKALGYVSSRLEKRRPVFRAARLVPMLACFVLVILVGGWAWFSPSATISVDINPSLELWVNRFDKVVNVVGWNEDGRELASSLDLKYMDYDLAIEEIMASDQVSSILLDDGVLSLAVVGDNEKQCGRLLSGLQRCTAGQGNAYCYSASEDELEEAHSLGLSYGKYRAYLELTELGADISSQALNQMTMREIRDMIDSLSGETESGSSQTHVPGSGQGQGQGSGQGKGPAWARKSEEEN